jgi:hypothetical protein
VRPPPTPEKMAVVLAAIVAAQVVDPCRYQHDWDDRNYEPPVCTQCGRVWEDPPREGDEDVDDAAKAH